MEDAGCQLEVGGTGVGRLLMLALFLVDFAYLVTIIMLYSHNRLPFISTVAVHLRQCVLLLYNLNGRLSLFRIPLLPRIYDTLHCASRDLQNRYRQATAWYVRGHQKVPQVCEFPSQRRERERRGFQVCPPLEVETSAIAVIMKAFASAARMQSSYISNTVLK